MLSGTEPRESHLGEGTKKGVRHELRLWGYSAHPLLDGDQLITLAGGEGSHSLP